MRSWCWWPPRPARFAISVPVTVVAAVGAATRTGALVKGGAALEALSTVRVVAFDKTGTLTRNRPTVIDVVATGGPWATLQNEDTCQRVEI